MRALVTGGAGYIGSHACKYLAQAGIEPIAYDNLERGHSWAVQWGELIEGSTFDQDLLAQTFKDKKIDIVLHFAAYAYVKESVEDPSLYYHNNVNGTLSLLSAMKTAGIQKLVFSSTCATYGIVDALPITEEQPQNPINPYGQSKLMVEKILLDYSKAYNLQFCALRYFNAAGADPDGDIGESHNPEPHIIPNAIRTALGKQKELEIFGNDYPTDDGTCVRDFIHVSDIAQAHVFVAQALINNEPLAPFYNLGNAKGFSLLDIVNTIEKITCKTLPYTIKARRAGDPPMLIGSSKKFLSRFPNWQRHNSPIERIIETAAQWEKIGPTS